ncbi:DUF2723 domain-containing protein [Bacteroidales bacterium OttesenSCG-928-C19]|nr:DUF2723 domain-containing protein [Bacteroidales bacterium OttesenSCG-928-C19]
MQKYHLRNNFIGWALFLVAAIVYLLTAEPSASWWDCGEYIATTYKLQVGHPPGAPTFQLIGRLFSFFAGGDVTKVAYMVNASSAISSAFTILFLFWSITLLAKKLVSRSGEMTATKMWGVFASGAIGALAYAFSDTFWFSAVEGEVYAMSSFFTAITFWAILKWEEQADQKHSVRWLILISFLIGLAIGVHLLNLLAIPAIVYVYYFKKYPKITKRGFLIAGAISIAILVGILYIIVPGIVVLVGGFEVFFVNSLSLPFNSGTLFFFLLLFACIVFGIVWSVKKNKQVLNASILALLFILIGYSTFFTLVIRSNANTPINNNTPKDAVAMRAYLGREQYGSTPLFYGPYYTAVNYKSTKEGYTKYVRGEDKYIEKSRSIEYVYDDKDCTVFPRMHSNRDERHIAHYKYWTGIKGNRKPTFSENLKFFFRYQVNFMYWRYFMWNFAGRQNDVQSQYFNDNGTRDYMHGNWISGIKFIDEMRLGPQGDLPDDLKNNNARNTFYFLPLILGLIGLIYHFKKSKKDTFVVFLLFFMTGLAIIIYLNQSPLQVRERDYAYAGSFYAFAIWIGLGVMGLTELLSKKLSYAKSLMIIFPITLLSVPVLMAQQGWDDHDRSNRTPARDFARNYLNSCENEAILITMADNDTFPLWFVQDVEGVRTDVRVMCYTLAGMHWHVEQMYNKIYESPKIEFTLPEEVYGIGWDFYAVQKNNQYIELKDFLEAVKKDTSILRKVGHNARLLPANKFKITLDKQNLVSKNIITEQTAQEIPDEIRWEITKNTITRSDLMLLDMIATSGFERPIHMINPYGIHDVFPVVNEYTQKIGDVYTLLPFKPEKKINTQRTYDNYIEPEWTWGNLNSPTVYVENPESMRQAGIQRYQFVLLAEELIKEGKTDEAKTILDLGLAYFPLDKIPMSATYSMYGPSLYAESYYQLGETEKAEELFLAIADYSRQYLRYYAQLKKKRARDVQEQDLEQYVRTWNYLGYIAKQYNLTKLKQELERPI